MAAQVARLRLFIAIIASEPDDSEKPLPNLEGRIVCADTLQTVADPNWSPFGTGHLQDVDDAVKAALSRSVPMPLNPSVQERREVNRKRRDHKRAKTPQS